MSYDRYPHVYKADIEKLMDSKLQQEFEDRFDKKVHYSQIDSIRPACGELIGLMAVVGVVGGFFVSWPEQHIADGLRVWGTCIVLSLVAGLLLRAAALAFHDGKVKKFKRYIETVRAEMEAEYQKYLQDFASAVMQTSMDFAGSELTQKVADDLFKVYAARINAADRRGHIVRIDVDFSFTVTNTQISNSVSNVLSFKVARFRDLNGPVEQAALANAIASAMELKFAMEMPTDISGTVPQIKANHAYGRNSAEVKFTYTAPNGGYQAVRDWK